MSAALSALAAVGGAIAFLGAVWAILRAIFAQVNSTKDNTEAIDKLSRSVQDLDVTVGRLRERVSRLEGHYPWSR